MAWTQLIFQTDATFAENLSDLLQAIGALSVTFQDAGDEPLFEPPLDQMVIWQQIQMTALFPETIHTEDVIHFLKAQLGENNLPPFKIETLLDQEWEKSWQHQHKPLSFGRLKIFPSHYLGDLLEPYLILDPGLAFGTGTHPTTALCLEWLDHHIKGQESIIDYGCGSGILALAALKLGAKKAFAVDYDPQAIAATHENALRNNISTMKLSTHLPNALPHQQVDILIANILANPLCELASLFHSLIKAEGKVILSGILIDQIPTIEKCYQPWFNMSDITIKEDWVRIVGIKHK